MIFDLQYQQEQPLNTPYESPNGFDHMNEVHTCEHVEGCHCETVHAVSHVVDTYIAAQGTKRVTTVYEYRDCLTCTNTSTKVLSKTIVDLGGAA